MNNRQPSICDLKNAIEKLEVLNGDKETIINKLSEAVVLLGAAAIEMNELEVKGRDNLDTLLGCMLILEDMVKEAE